MLIYINHIVMRHVQMDEDVLESGLISKDKIQHIIVN